MIEVTRRSFGPMSAAALHPKAVDSNASYLITPRMLGARGDGQMIDTRYLQLAFDLGRQDRRVVDLEGLTYLTGPLNISSGPAGQEWRAPPEVRGGQAVLRPAEPYDGPLVSCRNVSSKVLSHIRIWGDGKVKTCLDTSWDVFTAPSQNNLYDKIECRGAYGTQWIAQSNNDSIFRDILIEGAKGNGVALSLMANGGHVRLVSPVIFRGVVEVVCQSLTILDGVDSGYRVVGVDDNDLTFFGGYHYAAVDRGINVEIDQEGISATLNMIGGRFENGTSNGCIIGGSGRLTGTAIIQGCHMFVTNSAHGVRLVGEQLRSAEGTNGSRILINGGVFTSIDLSPTSQIDLIER